MTDDTFEPRATMPETTGEYRRLSNEPAVDLADEDEPLGASPVDEDEDDEDDGYVDDADGLPEDVRDGNVGEFEPEES